MQPALRVLMVEDVPTEAELALREFARRGVVVESRRVDTPLDFIRELVQLRPDVILSDFTLPQLDGWEVLRLAQTHAPDVPFVFLSGTIGEETAIESLQRGAMDYVLKDNLARLVPAVDRAQREMHARLERRRTTQQLRDIVTTSQDWIWEIDATNHIVFTSPSAEDVFGKPVITMQNIDFCTLVAAEDRLAVARLLKDLEAGRRTNQFLARFECDAGRVAWLDTRAVARVDAQGAIVGVRGASRDVTDQQEQQQRITHLTRILRMVSGVNGALVRLNNRNALLDEVCRLAVEIGGYACANVWLIEAGNIARSVACAGINNAQFDGLTIDCTSVGELDSSLISRAMRLRQAFVANDIQDPSIPVAHRAALLAAGVRGIVALPLTVDDTPVGALGLGTRTTDVVESDELNMLREVAANLSFALQYLQRDSAVQFLSYFDALTGSPNGDYFVTASERASGGVWVPNRGRQSLCSISSASG